MCVYSVKFFEVRLRKRLVFNNDDIFIVVALGIVRKVIRTGDNNTFIDNNDFMVENVAISVDKYVNTVID